MLKKSRYRFAGFDDEVDCPKLWNFLDEYTLFQNGRRFSFPLFTCKLALVASFLNSKFERIFSFKRGNKG